MRDGKDFYDQNVQVVHCGNKNLFQQSRWDDFSLDTLFDSMPVDGSSERGNIIHPL
jgi:hypothetical protein